MEYSGWMNECSKIVDAIVWIQNKHKNEWMNEATNIQLRMKYKIKPIKVILIFIRLNNFEGNCLVRS